MLPRLRSGGGRPGERALIAVVLVALLGLVAVPLLRLAWVVLGEDPSSIGRVLRAPGLGTAVAHSLELAIAVPVIAVPLGTGLALVLRRPGVPFRGVLRLLVLLPLLIPQFVLGYSWTQAYGRGGFTDELVGMHWSGLAGPAGIVVVLVADAVPICYLLTVVGLATRAQPELELAARLSGAGGWTVLRTVTLPLLRPVLAGQAVLTFVATLESFAAPQVLGAPAGYATVTTRLYGDLAFGSDPASFTDAVTLGFGLLLVAAAVLVPADLALGPRLRTRRSARTSSGLRAGPGRGRTAAEALVTAAVAGYGLMVVVLPTVALVAAALTRAVGLAPTPGNWTLANFRGALDAPTRAALWHSVRLALLAAVLLTVLGAAAAGLERRGVGRLLGTAAMLTFAVPGSALAVGMLIAYGNRLDGTLTLILLAYLAKFWALAHRTIGGAVDRMPRGEWQAARASGAGPLAAVRTVWLPALMPSLAGAGALVFVSALHEVTMSSLLYSAGTETFPVAVLNSQELGDTGTTAAQALVLTAAVVLVALPAWLVLRAGGRPRVAAVPAPVLEVAGVG